MGNTSSRAAAKILQAATKIFAVRGYYGTTTRAVAEELGLSAAAVYPHFASKEELLFAVTLDAHQQALAVVEGIDGDLAPTEHLHEVVRLFALWHANNTLLAKAAQHDLAAMNRDHVRAISVLRRTTTFRVRDVIADGVADGSFALNDPHGHAIAIISLCSDICRWFPGSSYSSPEELSQLYADAALRIVGARAER